MGKSSSPKMDVTDYRMSLHYGICHGPLDALLGIFVGEKEAWTGNVTSATAISVARPDLFGGIKKEGGVVGIAEYLPGGPTQVMPSGLAAKLGKTSATCPGYRGLASIFFHGASASGSYFGGLYGGALNGVGAHGPGFMWGSNNPYLRAIWMKVKRSPKALASNLRMIGGDANPAAIIYECLSDTDWGMGASSSIINLESFETAAQTLLNEGFGLSMQWTRQSTIETFVSEVIDHIQATLFVNPRDGLLTLKLIRDDYDVGDLPVLDETNCTVTGFDRKAWGETTNEIVVTWTNPTNEQEETVSAQDLANVTIQGSIISDSRNYYGVRNADLAMQLAKRDLASASSPLATFEIDVDRSAWDFVPGGCVVLNYPEYGIDGLVLRIGKIDYGKPGQPSIKVNAIEDIFSLPVSAYTVPDNSQWVDPSTDPEPMDLAWVITAPSYFTSAALSAADLEALSYPEVFAAVLASQDNGDTIAYDLVHQAIMPNGDEIGEVAGTKEMLGHCFLEDALVAEATTVIPEFPEVFGTAGPALTGFVFIGNATEEFQEIALIQSFSEDGWELLRGVLDTVPRDWPSGTPIWFVGRESNFIDTSTVRGASEIVRYKLLSRTSKGLLAEEDAPVVGTTLTGRPHLPNRPANVMVGDTAFGTLDVSDTSPTSITVSWANRNRLLEDAQVIPWTDDDITPEDGQTTTVAVYTPMGDLITAHDGLTGTSFELPATSFGIFAVGDVKVTSKRDGLESLQGATVRVKIRTGGWGDDWGNDWGGVDGSTIPPVEPPPEGGGTDPEPWWPFPLIPRWFDFL